MQGVRSSRDAAFDSVGFTERTLTEATNMINMGEVSHDRKGPSSVPTYLSHLERLLLRLCRLICGLTDIVDGSLVPLEPCSQPPRLHHQRSRQMNPDSRSCTKLVQATRGPRVRPGVSLDPPSSRFLQRTTSQRNPSLILMILFHPVDANAKGHSQTTPSQDIWLQPFRGTRPSSLAATRREGDRPGAL